MDVGITRKKTGSHIHLDQKANEVAKYYIYDQSPGPADRLELAIHIIERRTKTWSPL